MGCLDLRGCDWANTTMLPMMSPVLTLIGHSMAGCCFACDKEILIVLRYMNATWIIHLSLVYFPGVLTQGGLAVVTYV